MAKPTPVVDALNDVYVPLLTAFEQFHRQEHRFKIKYRLSKLAKRYDCFVHAARCWRRHVLNRIERLGGEANSELGKVVVKDEVKDAYKTTLDMLTEIYDAIGPAIKAAMAADDHPTHKILMSIQSEVDHKRSKVEAWLRQVDDLKDNYLIAVI